MRRLLNVDDPASVPTDTDEGSTSSDDVIFIDSDSDDD